MDNFTDLEETLFVPMLGRIHATENFPNILNDRVALGLKSKLPNNIKGAKTQTEYTLLAGAVRSSNMDRYIQDFLSRNSNGIIVLLGAGLETTFFRNDNGKNKFFEVDFPEVINYREKLLGNHDRDILVKGDALKEDWLEFIRKDYPDNPMLVVCSGVLYYFKVSQVELMCSNIKKYGNAELVFDIVNSTGLKLMGHYMKQVGHGDVDTYFYVDNSEEFASKVSGTLIKEEAYYRYTPKKGLKLSTKTTMFFSDRLRTVKMVHVKF